MDNLKILEKFKTENKENNYIEYIQLPSKDELDYQELEWEFLQFTCSEQWYFILWWEKVLISYSYDESWHIKISIPIKLLEKIYS